LQVRYATEQDKPKIDQLFFYGSLIHKHLDWQDPQDWFGTKQYYVLEQENELLGVFVIPEEPQGVFWLRLFIHSITISTKDAWEQFWKFFLLNTQNLHLPACLILLNEKLQPMLLSAGFRVVQKIVLLDRILPAGLPKRDNHGLILREMTYQDLEEVSEVDRESFSVLWQNSIKTLQAGFLAQGMGTVAISDGKICGYQLSTLSYSYCHLARLAVSPNYQGKGVGKALLNGLIEQLEAMNINRLSVNTQGDNVKSLALYEASGFRQLAIEYQVYQFQS
jgi:ribosomal-protein-alanine N-acetyltransferase